MAMTPALRKYVNAAEKADACDAALRGIHRDCTNVREALAWLTPGWATWVLEEMPGLPSAHIAALLRKASEGTNDWLSDDAAGILGGANRKRLNSGQVQRLVDTIDHPCDARWALKTRGVLTRKQRAHLRKRADDA